MTARIRIGTQGWNYDDWVGPFFPDGTRPADYLRIYARAFDTVEVDSTFYAIPATKVVRGWASRSPDDFVFALKMPQEITHQKRLRNCFDTAELFFERARELGAKLGPILCQLGPDFSPDEKPALLEFVERIPNDVQVAVEFRQKQWATDDVLAVLAAQKVAFALTDARWIPRAKMLELAERPTADFAYLRLMGPDRAIVDYSRIQVDRSEELGLWAPAIRALTTRVGSVYTYINNHFAGHSPATVRDLQRLLGQPSVDPAQLGEQMTLF